MGGLAEQEGKGIAYVDLKDAFFGKNPAWRQAKDPHGAFVRMVAADEICLQPCFRRKQEAAKASETPVWEAGKRRERGTQPALCPRLPGAWNFYADSPSLRMASSFHVNFIASETSEKEPSSLSLSSLLPVGTPSPPRLFKTPPQRPQASGGTWRSAAAFSLGRQGPQISMPACERGGKGLLTFFGQESWIVGEEDGLWAMGGAPKMDHVESDSERLNIKFVFDSLLKAKGFTVLVPTLNVSSH
uniref:Uncharacterized protein n=1 Tax=Chromera velia CCMP2878 TaxID=1169474 RepID=A0A0G4HX15_9ALVE|eukprot:Cvel_32970.t1-p1 / transcript=Cvel_32970.t1 / gene=Cvel_32970 / organism=Chromera_velia_CCMP2878 / gene_product=hypothetical protein / transcript_product=hypothetical protein / location=Cvel_scaffold5238:1806-5602(+) / protein_length=243 / sequence_SO=supercontig / SO=protein_coding / is_pseudo=false